MTGSAVLGEFQYLLNTFQLTEEVLQSGVEGDFAECGVFAGAHPAVMARACMEKGVKDRKVHLFDSFEGIPESGPMDRRDITDLIGIGCGRLVSTGVSACSLVSVQAHMCQWEVDPELLEYHPGWFQDTTLRFLRRLALLRLDGDLYESTKTCLDNLYGNLSEGGYCVIDDYPLAGCRAAVEEFFGVAGIAPKLQRVIGGPVYWRKS